MVSICLGYTNSLIDPREETLEETMMMIGMKAWLALLGSDNVKKADI